MTRLLEYKVKPFNLQGKRIIIRPLQFEDLENTFNWRNREDIRKFFIHSSVITWEQHLGWWKSYLEKSDDLVFIIEEKSRLIIPIGQISLYNIDLDGHKAEFGRLMICDKEWQGKGYGREATELLLSWAFRTIALDYIYLSVLKDNAVAKHVYEKCGFFVKQVEDTIIYMQILKIN